MLFLDDWLISLVRPSLMLFSILSISALIISMLFLPRNVINDCSASLYLPLIINQRGLSGLMKTIMKQHIGINDGIPTAILHSNEAPNSWQNTKAL